MNLRASESLLRWRWWVMALVAVVVILMEAVEHQPNGFGKPNSDFLREVLVFGLAFPLIGGVALGALAHTNWLPARLTHRLIRAATRVQRVLVVDSGLLLVDGVQSRLSGEADLEVTVILAEDGPALVDKIRQARADVVVLDEITHVADPILLLALLEEHSTLRVIVVSAETNLIRLYYKQQVLITQAADLANIIRAGWHNFSSVRKEGTR